MLDWRDGVHEQKDFEGRGEGQSADAGDGLVEGGEEEVSRKEKVGGAERRMRGGFATGEVHISSDVHIYWCCESILSCDLVSRTTLS